MSNVAISVQGLSKRYRVFESARARLLHAIWPGRRGAMQEIWALRDIGFEVRRGEAVGVIGRNGCGKSTLLQILTGTLTPTAGEVRVNGRISALLELGSGFNPEFTGRDNVLLNGLLLGLDRAEILARFDEIVEFAEIGDALDRPVKTYSTGMMMRLAFAVQVLTDPEILVIDEALSVGDFFFQQKCLGYIRSLCEKGVTLLFVSHDMGTVRDLCSRALYLREGRLQLAGPAKEAIRAYLAEKHDHEYEGAFAPDAVEAESLELSAILDDCIWRSTDRDFAPEAAHLLGVYVCDPTGAASTSFRLGGVMGLKIVYRPSSDMPTHVGVVIRNKYGQTITSTGSSRLGLTPPKPREGEIAIFEMSIGLQLEAGNYSLMVSLGGIRAPNQGNVFHSSTSIGPIEVHWDYEKDPAPFLGMVGLPAKGEFKTAAFKVAA